MATASEKELIESLIRKIGDTPALNGGFDKLSLMIEHVRQEQTKSGVKLDKISDAIYDPSTGLFSRVKDIETKIINNFTDIEKRITTIPPVIETELSEVKDVTGQQKAVLSELVSFKTNVQQICGNQLTELDALIKLRQNLSKIYWGLLATGAASIVALFFTTLKRIP